MVDEHELDLAKLNELFTKAENADRSLFAEMKSNVLLVSGKHWEKTSRKIRERIRNSHGDEKLKIRLTKNHINRICRTIVNEIISQAPGVRCTPHNESELQDQKSAELSNSVWQHLVHKHKIQSKLRDWCEDYVDLGEAAVQVLWDKNKGELKGYEQEVDEEGQPLFVTPNGIETPEPQSLNEFGQLLNHEPVQSNRAIFSGDLVYETILPFNLMRAPGIDDMEQSPYLITQKMMALADVKSLCDDEEKKIKITESSEGTFKVFDTQSGEFQEAKGQVRVKQIFYRKCQKYPNGQYAMWTDNVVVIEPMELPFGIFPIVWKGYQKVQTTPRAHSPIRDIRPLQAEINRMASQQAQNSITFGDDKLVIQGGSKVEKGAELSGTKVIRVTGPEPKHIPGRTGEQFILPLEKTVAEMYEIANVAAFQEDIPAQLDPNSLLYRSMRQKKKFSIYATGFAEFLTDLCQLSLAMARVYFPDDMVIKMVSKREAVNLPEFRALGQDDYAIKLMEIGDDIETMMGKSLQIQTILQYAGSDLPATAKAQIVNSMPFINGDQMFNDFMMPIKNADSDILALDRGEEVPPGFGEDHSYIIQRLTTRMKQRDFQLLDPMIQQNYQMKLQAHVDAQAEEAMKLKQMQSQFIPSGGVLVDVGIYVETENSQGGMKTVRWRAPQESITWLKQQLESQGWAMDQMQGLSESSQAQIADSFLSNGGGSQSIGSEAPINQAMPSQGAVNGSGPIEQSGSGNGSQPGIYDRIN